MHASIIRFSILEKTGRKDEERGNDRESRGHILSPLLENKVNSGMGLSKVDSGIGLPMINVLESTLESA